MARYRYITVIEVVLIKRIVRYYTRRLLKDLQNPVFGDGRRRSEYYLKRIKRKIKVLIPPERRIQGPVKPIRELIKEVTGTSFPDPGRKPKRSKRVRVPSPRLPRPTPGVVNPRVKNYLRNVPGSLTVYGGAGDFSNTSVSTAINEAYTRIDYSTPGWRGRAKGTHPITSSYSKAGRYVRLPYVDCSHGDSIPEHRTYAIGHSYGYGGFWSGMADFPSYPPFAPDLDDRVIGGLLQKVKDQKINLAQAFGERKQLVRLLYESAEAIAKSVSSLKKGDIAKAAKFLGVKQRRIVDKKAKKISHRLSVDTKELSRRWLELQYGWLPAMQDVYGAAELLAQKHLKQIPTHFSKQSSIVSKTTSSVVFGSYGGFVNNAEIEQTYTVKYSVKFNQSDEVSRLCSQTGIQNPAALAWELLPFSFVVDWFVGVGDFLSNLDAASGLQFVSGARSTALRQSMKVLASPHGAPNSLNPTYFAGFARSSRKDYILTRSALHTFPSQTLPEIKRDPFSPTHIANAFALLKTSFRVK